MAYADSDEVKARRVAKQKAEYKALADAGMCRECKVEHARHGKTRCAACGEKHCERSKRYEAHRRPDVQVGPFCLDCLASGGFHRHDCMGAK